MPWHWVVISLCIYLVTFETEQLYTLIGYLHIVFVQLLANFFTELSVLLICKNYLYILGTSLLIFVVNSFSSTHCLFIFLMMCFDELMNLFSKLSFKKIFWLVLSCEVKKKLPLQGHKDVLYFFLELNVLPFIFRSRILWNWYLYAWWRGRGRNYFH